MYGLTNKEVIELRLKCLEPFVAVASKTGIEQSVVIRKADEAWEYAVRPLRVDQVKTTQEV
jgi:hypothetical protein